MKRLIPVIDIFAGPGGLGEGFSAVGREEGATRFKVCLSIEKNKFAHQTLLLRSFFRQFPPSEVPDEYYAVLRGEKSLEDLRSRFRKDFSRAETEAWNAELGKEPWGEVSDRIRSVLKGADNWVLIGGPPCQPYSVVGRSRVKGLKNHRPHNDHRHTLYREYLRIIREHWPAVFVMENVPGLLSSKIGRERIFGRLLDDLEKPARALCNLSPVHLKRRHRYRICSLVQTQSLRDIRPEEFVVRAERLGVPQARHRLILVGIRDDLSSTPRLLPKMDPVPASHVLDGLPPLRSGLSREMDGGEVWKYRLREAQGRRWLQGAKRKGGPEVYDELCSTMEKIRVPRSQRGGEFVPWAPTIQHEPTWYLDHRIGGVCNHLSKAHRVDDLHRYLYAACFAKVKGRSPRLSDFPPDLLPEHQSAAESLKNGEMFSDRFRVQLSDRPATTVTSHISKDGHYYIHPDPLQCRSLTVREAARLQTFPDNYFFMGSRTAQYRQVGNAVPPLMAKLIAEKIHEVMREAGFSD